MSQPKNIFKIALIYVASQIMGPYGAALVNTLYDKYILEKKMDFEEMLISFGVGAAAGYAAEGAHSLVAGTTEAKNFMDHSSYLAKASARLAQDVVADVGNAVLNEDKYSSKDFFESLAMALGSVEIGNNVSAQIMESTLEGATKSAASQIVREDFNFSKIDMQKIENGLYEGAANGITREAVHELVDIVLIDNLPEDYKRIDKKINKKISDILYDAFSSDPKFQENLSLRLIYEELEGLEEDKKEELVNLIDKEGKLALERSANKINKNSKDLTIEDFNNPIFINELKKQESIIIERLSENDLILNISTGSEVIEKRRAPSAALLPLVLGVAALGSMVLSIQEVHDIYIMSEGEKRNNAALNLAQTEGGFLLLGALLGPAVVGGKAAYKVGSKIFSKFKKVFNPSFNIVSSARKLGLKTKEGIKDFAELGKRVLGNDISAVGDIAKAIRKSYVREVENLSRLASKMGRTGKSQREIAEEVLSKRNQLKVKYRNISPSNSKKLMEDRNLKKYGNKIGPNVDYFLKKGASLEEIIEKSGRAGGQDMGL